MRKAILYIAIVVILSVVFLAWQRGRELRLEKEGNAAPIAVVSTVK